MGKWTNLKGTLPTAPGDPTYTEKVRTEQEKKRTVTETVGNAIGEPVGEVTRPAVMADFVLAYNALKAEKEKIGEREAEINIELEALTNLINSALEESGSDIWRGEGYSFSEKIEPYAAIADKSAVMNHFVPLKKIREDLTKLLKKRTLTRKDFVKVIHALAAAEVQAGILSVPYQTLNAMVKAEAEAGELIIETIKGGDGQDDTTVVKSTIPGVTVFLKTGINRRKS